MARENNFHTITSILKPYFPPVYLFVGSGFPYDYVYFKATFGYLVTFGPFLFPYDYVYFKAQQSEPTKALQGDYFHTITSILKLVRADLKGDSYQIFPYDYVYFKARPVLVIMFSP